MYNLIRKVIGCNSDLPSVKTIFEIASTLDEWDAISFYYDRLCKTEPRKLLTLKLKLQACS